MTILAIITPYVDSTITIAGLAFFASLQVGIFKRVRGVNYASFMMTGNITNTSLTVARAIDEGDPKVLKQASYTTIIIFTFMVGVAASTWFAQYLHEYSLYTTLLPLFILNYFLFIEAKTKTQLEVLRLRFLSDPSRIRTCDRSLRRRMLYPAELWDQ